MNRIKQLEREIELTRQLIELRKQLSAPIYVNYPVYVPTVWQPYYQYPWNGTVTTPNTGQAISSGTVTWVDQADQQVSYT